VFKTVYVNHYYIYLDEAEFGSALLKVCSYSPWGMKLCINGHEWPNGNRTSGGSVTKHSTMASQLYRPEKLQEICDSLGPAL